MARQPRFTPKKTKAGWCLNVPAKYTVSKKKRERHFFPTQAKALEAAGKLKQQREVLGTQAQAIGPALAEMATAADQILQPWGLSILDAAKLAVELKERENASRPLGKAADLWLAACDGLRPRTVRNYKLTADRLKKDLAEKLMAAITAEELQAAIAPPGGSPTAAAERIRNAKAFWRWSASKGWCKAEVYNGVETPKSSRDHDEISILTPQAAGGLLEIAEKHFPQTVASFALQLFAGIRAEELIRLDASHVTPDGIDLPASVTKKGRRRHITPSATLRQWLTAYPFTPCSNWREVSAACRRLAGWDVSARLLADLVERGKIPEPGPVDRGRWPQNCLRHSHASYAVASGVPLEDLLFEFGHAGTPTLLRQHYVGRASKKQAVEFFAIGPRGSEIPAINAA